MRRRLCVPVASKEEQSYTLTAKRREERLLAAAARQSEPERKEPFIDFRSP